jgi:hypothetical protein
MNFLKKIIDLLIPIKHFGAKIVMNFVLISINLLLIIKLFIMKVVMNLFKILLDLLIHLRAVVGKPIMTFVEITVSLCSKVGKVVMYLLIMSTKMWKFWSLNNFVRLIAFVTLFYQIILVTISYSQFETVIDMKAISDFKNEPTITFCLKNDDQFPKRAQNSFFENLFHNPIGCRLAKRGKYLAIKCNNLTKIVESVTTFSQKCRSYFSQLFDNKPNPIQYDFNFIIDNNMSAFALIHQKKTPPHFARQKIEIPKSTSTVIDYTRIFTKLLPFPYSTDCYDYGNEENPLLNYKSREDCIVKHLEKKEFNECGCNKRWFYGYSNHQNLSNICQKSVECKFNAKSEMKSLEKICKFNCLNEYYMNILVNQREEKGLSPLNINNLVFIRCKKYEILLTYLPKMNLIQYLCSIGGLISMWFGFSVYDLVLIFTKESKKKILLLLVSMKYRFFITVIVKFKEIITSKVNHIFSSIIIIIFSALMLIQTIGLIRSYFDFEVITRFDVQQIKLIPNVDILFRPMPNLNKLYEIYPQMKQEIDEINENKLFAKQLKYLKVAQKYLVHLLIDNRLNDFHSISQANNIIKSCQIKIFDEIQLKNFTPGEFGIEHMNLELITLSRLFDFSKLDDKNKVEKITLQLNLSPYEMFAIFYLTLTQTIPKSFVFIASNAKTTASFTTFVTKKLRSNEIECISEENQKDFSEDYFKFCRYDCVVDKLNQLCGCVPVYDVPFYFSKSFLKNNYKFCESCESLDNSTAFSIGNQCKKICKPKCNSLNFDTKVEVSKHVSNKTILEIIPTKTPRIAYIETLKTDLNRLIYNCGGILGLWFGLTPTKVVDLIEYMPKIYRISMNVCATVFQFLIAFWMRIKQK